MKPIVSADSHMLVLDEHVVEELPAGHRETYLDLPGAHRRSGSREGRAGEWDPAARLVDMDLDGVETEQFPQITLNFYAFALFQANLLCLSGRRSQCLAASDPGAIDRCQISLLALPGKR